MLFLFMLWCRTPLHLHFRLFAWPLQCLVFYFLLQANGIMIHFYLYVLDGNDRTTLHNRSILRLWFDVFTDRQAVYEWKLSGIKKKHNYKNSLSLSLLTLYFQPDSSPLPFLCGVCCFPTNQPKKIGNYSLWWRPTSWRLFTPRQKKRQLISERIKGPLIVAFRSPLMKALDRSVETLGRWIVTSRLHSLNL